MYLFFLEVIRLAFLKLLLLNPQDPIFYSLITLSFVSLLPDLAASFSELGDIETCKFSYFLST